MRHINPPDRSVERSASASALGSPERSRDPLTSILIDRSLSIIGAVTLFIALTGGGQFTLAGVRLSLHDWRRPLLGYVVLLTVWMVWLWRHDQQSDRPARLAEHAAVIGLWSIVCVMPALWLAYLDAACGGLDSHGYVSAARLIASFRLSIPQPTEWLPLDNAIDVLTPLGWVPGPDGHSIVPEFPLGLPVVMALFQHVFGPNGPFYVSPVLGVATLALTYVMTARIATPRTALLAATLVAVHPLFFAYAIQPMSDVATTMWLVLGTALLLRPRPHALLSGLAVGLGVLTRPPLGLAALLLPWLLIARRRSELVRYYVGLAASIGVLMILQWMMYGNPFTSGHGSASQVFTTQFFWRNVLHHAKWFLIVHTPLIVLFLVAAWRWGSKPFARTACAIFLAVSAPYMFYGVPFDDWEMLRFLMPGFVFLIMASADGAEQLAVHFAPRVTRTLATLVVGVAALTASYLYLQHQHVFRLSYAESKYPAVAAWISANTPDDAVVLASLHSGSVRHYSGRLTLRWDRIPSDRLAATVRAISARGSRAFLVLDGDERAQFAKRFGERHLEVINRVRTVDTVDIARFAVE